MALVRLGGYGFVWIVTNERDLRESWVETLLFKLNNFHLLRAPPCRKEVRCGLKGLNVIFGLFEIGPMQMDRKRLLGPESGCDFDT